MSHADVHVCGDDQQLVTRPRFSKYGKLKLCSPASNVPIIRSTELHRLRSEKGAGMDWM